MIGRMAERKGIPPWFEFVVRHDRSAALDLFKRLNCGTSLAAREALFWSADDAEKDRGLIALQAHLAGSIAPEITVAAIDYCHSLDIDFPFLDPPREGGADRGRLDAMEALFRTVVARDPGRAEVHAMRAVVSGSRNRTMVRAYVRNRYRNGYFENLSAFRPVIRTEALDELFSRVAQDTQLLRYGFVMPKLAAVEPLVGADPNRALCLLHNSLPINSGGYSARTHGLLTGIAAQGFQVSAVTRLGYPQDRAHGKPSGTIEPCDIVDGISYRRLSNPDVTYGKTPIINYLKANILAHFPLVKREKPAILHGVSNFANGVTASFLARKFGLKSVYEVRGLWEITAASRDPAYAASDSFRQFVRMEAEACNNVDRVICITEALKQEMTNRGVDAAKITVVPNGVDTARFRPRAAHKPTADRLGIADTDIVIGYVGSVVDYEGLDDLLWAVRILTKDLRLATVRLLVVGDGDALAPLQELARALEISDRVLFTGRVSHKEVEDYYSLMTIMPFPRRPLPVCEMVSPLKPLEAMAMGKCVLVSSVAALAEMVVDGQTGLIFEKGNAPSLVAALRRAILDPGLCAQLGMQARVWVERHRSWTSLSAKVVELYRDMVPAADRPEGTSSAANGP